MISVATAPSTAPTPDPDKAPKRRSRRVENGAGSVHWDAARKRWVAQGYLDGRGTPRVKRYATTKGDARAALAKARREYADGLAVTDRVTVAQLADYWTTRVVPGKKIAPDTRNTYLTLAARWREVFGTRRADQVTVDQVEQALDRMATGVPRKSPRPGQGKWERRPLAKATLTTARQVLGAIFDQGIRRRLLQFNPARLAELPPSAAPARKRNAMTEDQAKRFLGACAARTTAAAADGGHGHDPMGAMFVLMLATGIGPAEATALPWRHVNLEDPEGPTITIAQGVQREHGRGSIKPGSKNDFRTRTIGLPTWAATRLTEHRAAQRKARMAAADWESPSLVFTTRVGTLLDTANVRRAFADVCRAAELDGFTPYSLRHTFSSLAIEAGANLVVVADALGHADTTMLSRVYRHRLKPAERAHVAALEALG